MWQTSRFSPIKSTWYKSSCLVSSGIWFATCVWKIQTMVSRSIESTRGFNNWTPSPWINSNGCDPTNALACSNSSRRVSCSGQMRAFNHNFSSASVKSTCRRQIDFYTFGSFAFYTSAKSNDFRFLIRWLSSSLCMISTRWSKRSSIAVVMPWSSINSPHWSGLLFEVRMIELLS